MSHRNAAALLMKSNKSLPPNQPTPDAAREWLRVKEACTYSCLSKAKLYDLMNRGLVKSSSLRERGQIKGTRLVSFDSLRQFLESRASGGAAA
jgi:predicted DNA-binding transcriptional regulator AlpA